MSEGKTERNRIRIIITLVVIAGVLVIGRLFSLQVINGNEYKDRAEHQYVTPSTDVFDRGNILFTNKNGTTVAAATVTSGFKAAINPSQIKEPEKTYEELNKIVPIDRAKFMDQVAKKSDPYEEIAQQISTDDGDKISKLNLPGVTLYRQKWRFYPGGSLAAKAIGFVSYKGNNLVGNYGLEEYYNDVLTKSANDFYVNFFAEIFANIQSTVFKNRTAIGDIKTTIEPTVQSELENAVRGVQEKWSSESVGGIVMDPKTGEIIAMANVPNFDLNHFGEVENVSTYNNPLAQSAFEMGSIIKPLIMAAAINEGVVTPETTYFDSGLVTVNGKVINNFDKRGRGKATMQDVLNQSLNTGMVFVEQKLGKQKFKEYLLDKYHMGEKTGVDLPGEINGLVSSLKDNNDVNYATAAFGQGIATTPLNIVRGYAMLANGGTLVTPHLVSAIEEENGTEKVLEYKTTPNVLKPETISTVRNMMVHVVDDGYHKGMQHYKVAAKTGTAQISKLNGGGYYDDRNLHSLIGFFPASDPKYVVYFFNYYPKGVRYAIETLADPFFHMIQFLGNYYEIAPDR